MQHTQALPTDTQFFILSSPTVKTMRHFFDCCHTCVYEYDIGPIDLGLLGCVCAGVATRNLLSCRPQQIYSEPQTPINGRRAEEQKQEGALLSLSLPVSKVDVCVNTRAHEEFLFVVFVYHHVSTYIYKQCMYAK